MEYEIDDDPQGLPDEQEADRDGGIRVDAHSRREPRFESRPRHHEPIEQLGEPA